MKNALALFFCLMMTGLQSLPAADLKLTNAGFEQAGGWTRIEGNASSIVTAASHSGTASLLIDNPTMTSSATESLPVQLTVGRLYRLSAWIKTEHAISDPTSRYPTAVPATITMASFPFTNHAPSVGGTKDWQQTSILFFATQKEDRVRLHIGNNGGATGKAWFDDVTIEEVNDITQYVPMETVKWFGPAFRYYDNGWIFLHIEGDAYQRGYQYGYLLAKEIGAYMDAIALRYSPDNPKIAWAERRTLTDALFYRKYDQELLTEMKGITDGALKAGASITGRPIDLLDVVTMNSIVDIGQLGDALAKTSTPLSGRSFRVQEDEMNVPERLHKCSSFLANGPASKNGDIVFGQLFMWNGYTGVHWNVICDLQPAKGHRLVYETFPGGIHSGSDFYINDSGIMIGETTGAQTPFETDGTPQSSRIRLAAQYGECIDQVVKILTEKNNGLYTNDWLIADTKTNEIAILLLGTKQSKLWRSTANDFPGGTTGFYWSVNNAKDSDVRKEYIPDPNNAPFDFIYGNVYRDTSFLNYYQREKGAIDAPSAVRLLGSSPINRPHACDGKVATGTMAKEMMLFAHYGKVTMREKFPEKNSRLMYDYPNAIPHLSLGYTTFSPKYVVEKMKALRPAPAADAPRPEQDLSDVRDVYSFNARSLWFNTVYPAAEADNWFVSGTAAYWNVLNGLPSDVKAASASLRDQLTEMNCRYLYVTSREGGKAADRAERRYDGFRDYLIPRIKGTYALHQLRLKLGNDIFSSVMNGVHSQYKEKPMKTAQFIASAEKLSGATLRPFVMQWLERDDVPSPSFIARSAQIDSGWQVTVTVKQPSVPYDFFTTVAIESAQKTKYFLTEISAENQTRTFFVKEKPVKITFNAGNDIPVPRDRYFTYSNFFDDFHQTLIVYGTSVSIEAQHTLALRYQTVLADVFTERLLPVMKESEVDETDLAAHDIILLGGSAENSLSRAVAEKYGLKLGKHMFQWHGSGVAKSLQSPQGDLPDRCKQLPAAPSND
ncbi:MAG: hypothetical protein NTV54_02220 [Ignavibacteriales bacterium]|nr:hypothetical protein [Ignavibacteriales bacterium]